MNPRLEALSSQTGRRFWLSECRGVPKRPIGHQSGLQFFGPCQSLRRTSTNNKKMKAKDRSLVRAIALLCCLWCVSCQTRSEETPLFETKEFAKPSMSWRPIPLWFWNNTQVSEQALLEQIGRMVETDGYGGCAILPFGGGFRPNYLSDSYFQLYGDAVEKARSLGAHMSIYDEYGFPSGSMGPSTVRA